MKIKYRANKIKEKKKAKIYNSTQNIYIYIRM